MGSDRFRALLEAADNFVKYGGGSARSLRRARERFEEVAREAEAAGDEESAARARLRLEDLEREQDAPRGPTDVDIASDREPGGPAPVADRARVPPGQRVKRGWPVLHEGRIPRFDRSTWRLRVWGEVTRPIELGYDELRSLPNIETTSDFHCVTGWSKLDNRWTGVRVVDLLSRVEPTDPASHAVIHAEYGYTANLPLGVLHEPESILAWAHDGEDLAPKHGFPLRLVVPKLYAWKSVKWVRGIELLDHDSRGFWEVRGYHNRADPWRQERYSYQE